MKNAILDIDHLMVSVASSQRAGETFERLGFTLTPRSALPGMSNRLICFEPVSPDRCNFVELLGFDDRSKAPSFMHDVLGTNERPVSMVMVSNDARAAEQSLRDAGFDPLPVFQLKRDWTLPGGEIISPEFAICLLKKGSSPLYWNAVEYIGGSQQHYRRPEFIAHANSAIALRAVLAVADNPESVASHFENAWGAQRIATRDGTLAVSLKAVALRLLTPAQARATYPQLMVPDPAGGASYLGFSLAFADMRIARQHLESSKISFGSGADGGMWISPGAAHGCLVAYEAA